jgi:hypothetical protein
MADFAQRLSGGDPAAYGQYGGAGLDTMGNDYYGDNTRNEVRRVSTLLAWPGNGVGPPSLFLPTPGRPAPPQPHVACHAACFVSDTAAAVAASGPRVCGGGRCRNGDVSL